MSGVDERSVTTEHDLPSAGGVRSVHRVHAIVLVPGDRLPYKRDDTRHAPERRPLDDAR
jgi:hypothetical protein